IFTILTFKRYRQVKFLFVLLAILPPFFYKMSYYFRSTDDLYPNTVVFNRWYPYSSVFEKESFSFRHILYQEGMRQSHERPINKNKNYMKYLKLKLIIFIYSIFGIYGTVFSQKFIYKSPPKSAYQFNTNQFLKVKNEYFRYAKNLTDYLPASYSTRGDVDYTT